jgi:hydroxymethylpyrimidine/phosphomethylpyrimidine kinase
MNPAPPLVLCLSGLDPTGGAGIQADIEAIAATGAHALPVVTALTVQDTRNVVSSTAVNPDLIARQIDALIADCRIAAVKIGLLGDATQVDLIVERLTTLDVPVVCDPVLRAGGGTDLVTAGLLAALRERLLPRVTVLTPNAAEARRLASGAEDVSGCAQSLLARGCRHVLITGGDEPGASVVNIWFTSGQIPRRFEWTRLPETFHGAGCTLAAAIAARLAHGAAIGAAIEDAQRWTQKALEHALRVGKGRRVPRRLNVEDGA